MKKKRKSNLSDFFNQPQKKLLQKFYVMVTVTALSGVFLVLGVDRIINETVPTENKPAKPIGKSAFIETEFTSPGCTASGDLATSTTKIMIEIAESDKARFNEHMMDIFSFIRQRHADFVDIRIEEKFKTMSTRNLLNNFEHSPNGQIFYTENNANLKKLTKKAFTDIAGIPVRNVSFTLPSITIPPEMQIPEACPPAGLVM